MFGLLKKQEVLKPKRSHKRWLFSKKKSKKEVPDDTPPDDFSEQEVYPESFLPPDASKETTADKPSKKKSKRKKEKPKKTPSEAPFYRNRLVIGTACVSAACVIAFVLVPVMSYVTGTQMTTVAIMTTPLEKGKKIESCMVRTEKIPAQGLPGSALQDEKQAVGSYAAVDLVAGDLLLKSKLTDSVPFPNDYLYEIPQGKQAISATIPSFATGLSGKLLAGDIVSIYAVPNQTESQETDFHAVQPPELRYVRVLAVTNVLGLDKQRDEPSDSKNAELQDEENQPATITLLTQPEQAEAIAGLEVNAKLHLALVSRGDEQAAQSYLKAQQDYLDDAAEQDEQDLKDLLNDDEVKELLGESDDYSALNPEPAESAVKTNE